jgi:ArsR family transcriptional regulator
MRALDLPAQTVEAALLALIPENAGRLLDIGTGTGRLLELLAPRIVQGLGVDASKQMLALARSRLARADLSHCAVRLADMYRLPLSDAGFDLALLHMVLHYAEQPEFVLAEAARVLRPGGWLIVVDLAAHHDTDVSTRLAHRWPGFTDEAMRRLMRDAGLVPGARIAISGPMELCIWPAERATTDATTETLPQRTHA